MKLTIAVNMLLKSVSCWVSRGGKKKSLYREALFLSRKCTLSCQLAARESVSSHVPLARDSRWRACSHTTYLPSWNPSRSSLSHYHVISMDTHSWLLVNHVISHAFPIATKSWYHTRTEILTPLYNPFAPWDFAIKRVLKLYHKAVYRSYSSWPSDPDAKY